MGARRDDQRRDDRLHDRLGHRVGDRAVRRPPVPRAPRAVVPPRSDRLDRADRWFDRWDDLAVFVGRLTPVARLIRLHSGRRVRDTVRALHGADVRRLHDLVLGFALGGFLLGPHWEDRTTASGTWSTRLSSRSLKGSRISSWKRRSGGERTGMIESGVPPGQIHSTSIVPRVPLIDVPAQYAPLKAELEQAFRRVLESGAFIRGPEFKTFEEESAAYLGVRHTVGVANGTDALVLVLDVMDIGPGDEVILPGVHVLRDCRVDRPTRCDAGVRGHRPGDAQSRSGGRGRPDYTADEGADARPPVRATGAGRELAELGLPIIEDAAQAWAPQDGDEHRLDLQLHPRRTCSASATAASSPSTTTSSPSASGCSRSTARATRRTSSTSGTTRGLDELQAAFRGSSCRMWTSGTVAAGRPQRGTRSSESARPASRRSTSPGTSTTCSCAARRSGTASARRHRGRDRVRRLLHDAAAPATGAPLPRLHGGLPAGDRARRARDLCALWPSISTEVQEEVVETVRAAVGAAVT